MSSANLVSLILIPEDEYGVTPTPLSAVVSQAIRFTSESLSGTPQTTQSTEIRTDRMASGQVVTGSDIGGGIECELSADPVYDSLMSGAMMSEWNAQVVTAATDIIVTQDAGDPQKYTIASATIDFTSLGLAVGDFVVLQGFLDEEFNTPYKVAEAPSAGSLVVWGPRSLGSAPAGGTALVQPAYLDIGSETISFTLSKAYRDVISANPDYRGQTYPGSLVSAFAMSATYGAIMTASFTTMANGYIQDNPALEQMIETAGGTNTPPGTTNSLNATVDAGLVIVEGQATDFCIESIEMTLDNNLTPQNCIGKIAPSKYNLGTASIGITMSIYNSEPSYAAFMPKKWTQEPVDISFTAVNLDGGYIFDLRAVQLSFPDPAASGENTQVMIEAQGVGKVGANGESALRIYKVT